VKRPETSHSTCIDISISKGVFHRKLAPISWSFMLVIAGSVPAKEL